MNKSVLAFILRLTCSPDCNNLFTFCKVYVFDSYIVTYLLYNCYEIIIITLLLLSLNLFYNFAIDFC